ncbi:MAG: hypothetical protein RR585_03540 [Coprobacillus sp.]
MSKILKSVLIIIVLSVLSVGCSSKNDKDKETTFISIENSELIYEESISPNKEYTKSDKDIVTYSIQVYYDNNHGIIVNAKSNSEFFDQLQYVLDYKEAISKSDISIKWTTLMGDDKYTEENQLAIACVSISSDNKVFSERKVNFINKGIEVVVDAINNAKN